MLQKASIGWSCRLLAAALLATALGGSLAQAQTASQQRALDEAEELFQSAIAAQQQGADARSQSLLADAERRFRAVLRFDPRQAIALGRLGAVLYQFHRYKEARELLAPAVAAGLRDPEVRWQLALALEALHDVTGARAIAEQQTSEPSSGF